MFIIYGSDNNVVFAGEGLDAVPDGVQVFAGDKAACAQQVSDAGLTTTLEVQRLLADTDNARLAVDLATTIRDAQAALAEISDLPPGISHNISQYQPSPAIRPNPPVEAK